jgi:hypothetical protein
MAGIPGGTNFEPVSKALRGRSERIDAMMRPCGCRVAAARSTGGVIMRRFVVLLTGVTMVLLSSAVVILRPPAAAQEATPDTAALMAMATHPLVGAWQWSNNPGDPLASYTYAIFHDDGTYTEYDPALGVGIGVWRPTGERTADLTIVFQDIDPAQEVFAPGWASFWIAIEVDETGNAMTGEGNLEARRPNGEVVAQFPYTGFGTRLTVDTKTPLNMPLAGTPMAGTPMP